MTILDVLQVPHPILNATASPVESFNSELGTLAQDMAETMLKNNLVGIAGNQVGSLLRVIVVNFGTTENPNPVIMVNPVVKHLGTSKKDKSAGKLWMWDGCGSIPNKRFLVERTVKVEVTFKNTHGNDVGLTLSSPMSFVVQHEVDHLNGICLNKAGKFRSVQIVK
jgi:peptide deformylase